MKKNHLDHIVLKVSGKDVLDFDIDVWNERTILHSPVSCKDEREIMVHYVGSHGVCGV